MAQAKSVHSTPRRTPSKIQTKPSAVSRGGVMAKASKKKKALPTKKQNDATNAKTSRRVSQHGAPRLCAWGQIASMLFDDPDEGLFIFAVTHLEEMLEQFRKHYYAEDFEL
jgi:hypothetical protein